MRVEEVARLLDTTPATIRIGLQKGLLPFGVAFKTREDSKHYTYIIYPAKVMEYAGGREGDNSDVLGRRMPL